MLIINILCSSMQNNLLLYLVLLSNRMISNFYTNMLAARCACAVRAQRNQLTSAHLMSCPHNLKIPTEGNCDPELKKNSTTGLT